MKVRPAAMALSLLLISALQLGCGASSESNDTSGEQAQDEVTPTKHSCCTDVESADQEIAVTIADRAAYDDMLAKHKGKVILVDFWATWCGPCVKQFPHTVELSKKYDPATLAVISVSMDQPDDREKVLEFLRNKGAAFDNLISQYGIGQKGFEAFDVSDGAIPHYKLYDRAGVVRHATNDPNEVEVWINELLNAE